MRLSFIAGFIFVISTFPFAQGQQPAARKSTGAPSPTRVKVVAGVVSEAGTVRYLPRVKVRLMSKAYSDAERAATNTYSTDLDALRTERDAAIKKLVEGRRSELSDAKAQYDQQLELALQNVHLDPYSAAPDCILYETILNKVEGTCDQKYAIGQKTYLSPQLRRLFVNPAVIGDFDVKTFTPERAPFTRNRASALSSIPLDVWQQVPEFGKQLQKAVEKERGQAKLKSSDSVPPEVARAAVARFLNEWDKATSRSSSYIYGGGQLNKFGNITPEFFTTALTHIQAVAKQTVKAATDKPLNAYIAAKDRINAKYDAQQAQADAAFKRGAEQAEERRSSALEAALKRSPAVQESTTSLQGETSLAVPAGMYTIFAEDTTTDQHWRWSIPVPAKRSPSLTIELTDANALKATPTTIASLASQPTYPKAQSLSETDRAEYTLRYGSRLLKSWSTTALLHDAEAIGDEIEVVDTPLGFGFQVRAMSTSVFNTLRMTDNDIAGRFFKDLVAPYLQSLPQDLRTIGGSQAFEAVSLRIVGRKKSFLEKYAVGDSFVLTYTFRIADADSYAGQKIDAQQLLDRSHITHDQVGRISVKLVAAQ